MGDPKEIIDRDGMAEALLAMVRELAAELHPRRFLTKPVTLDSSLTRDLGLDSLARVELLARIGKRFRVSIPERALADIETPRDLLRVLLSTGTAKAPSTVSANRSGASRESRFLYHTAHKRSSMW